ncbi:MAG: sensor domain-containing diguanylate cyclase [Actinomycetota bacterium]
MSRIATLVSAITLLSGVQTVAPEDDLLLEAQIWAVAEIDLLGELGAFTPNPVAERIAAEYPTPATARFDLLDLLELSEDVNEDLLRDLRDQGRRLSPATIDTLLLVPDEIWDRIVRGEKGFLDPQLWLDGTADLIIRDGRAPEVRDDADHLVILDYLDLPFDDLTEPPPSAAAPPGTAPERSAPTTVAPAADLPTATTVAPAADLPVPTTVPAADDATDDDAVAAVSSTGAEEPTSTDRPPFELIAGVAGGLLLVAAAALARPLRRRRSSAASPAAGLDDLLDTSRRLAAALDGTRVRQIAVSDAMRMTGAEAGAFLATDDGPTRFVEANAAPLFAEGEVTGGLLLRVVETGQPASAVIQDDPAIVRLPMAMAACPVISAGEVIGALVVIRNAASPFDAAATESLRLLAPVVGSALSASAAHRNAVVDAELDGLTNLNNRRRLDRDLASLTDEAASFAMVDVDHFKAFNDTHGHQAGDVALRTVADVLAANVRDEDVVYRYGGEEFSVLLPGATSAEAVRVLDRVRRAVASTDVLDERGQLIGRVTISVGVVEDAGTSTGPSLPEQADRALYEAKSGGRNQVVVADGD